MSVARSINKLRITALFLFLIPAIGLLGSLFLNNYFVSFKFERDLNYNFVTIQPGSKVTILCNELNNYCQTDNFEKFNKLGECYKYEPFIYISNIAVLYILIID